MKNQDAWKFGVQVSFSAIVLIFCLFKLGGNESSTNQAIYWGGITGVLAWWMPSPNGSTSPLGAAGSSPVSSSNPGGSSSSPASIGESRPTAAGRGERKAA